ncbi:protein kinase domain-containing protein [Lentisalinibacter orientalis]|uniref:protein kinase domain-containing protein n=1 Tax=Lentisalinibacter orientalis TaxID=2992241 RepID=UPI003865B383
MTEAGRSKRVLDICDEAVVLGDEARIRFLDKVCAGDPKLRASVDSVLLAIEESGNFLKLQLPSDGVEDGFIDRTVDNYHILERLGEGGMGAVYLAERRTEEFKQRVAIKFVRGAMLARELVKRFDAERKILAGLNHPYIAALIDGGRTSDGIPYLVMEYVEGLPIDEYCDARRLGLRERIRLLQKVATAVQAAHQNLVIHRDLKPSNVLITQDGIPKLLDFGIAKLIEDAEAQAPGDVTVIGRQALTPDYASPEQILENRVTTASDVYTLGILAYQLLVGERPYRLETGSHRDMVRTFEGLTVPRPSTRLQRIREADQRNAIARSRATSVGKLQRALEGDLEKILMMALRQEPDRRYASVAQFSEDLDRYLAGLPVKARDSGMGYRLGKFIRRNWIASAAVTMVIVSLAVGLLAYATQAREAARQRDIAREQAANARDTVDFLKAVLFAGDPFATSEKEETIADVLDYAEANLANAYADSPGSRATILVALGDIFVARGDYERGRNLSLEALAIYDRMAQADGNAAANAHRALGLSLYYLGDYEAAAREFDTAISLYLEQDSPDWSGLVRAYDQMGNVQGELTTEATAAEYYERALTLYRQEKLEDSEQLVTILNNIATDRMQRGEYEQAEPVFLQAVDAARKGNVGPVRQAILLSNLAGVQKNTGRLDQAVENYKAAARTLTDVLGEGHAETITSLTSLANLHRQMGAAGEAEAVIRRAVAGVKASSGTNPFIVSYVENVGGIILCEQGDVGEGTSLARSSLQSRRELLPEGHWAISSGESVLGLCLTMAGAYAAAEDHLLRALDHLTETRGPDHEVTESTRERVIDLYKRWQKPEEAARYISATN